MKNIATLLTAWFLALAATTFAQPGSLDSTFGTNGKVFTTFGTSYDQGYAVAIQADGKVVVAGYSNKNPDDDFAVARYNTDGTLDNSFGTDGKVTTPIGIYDEWGKSVAIQADGKIVVAGSTSSDTDDDFALVRYNTDGTLDTSFSGDGKVTTDFAMDYDQANSVALQVDAKIIVAGYMFAGIDVDFALVRYNPDGTLDSSFGGDGKVTTDFGTGDDIGNSVTIQADGKIVAAGYTSNFGDCDLALARYNTDGSLDNSFGAGGLVTTDFANVCEQGNSIAIQADGKILLAGDTYNGMDSDFALARYNTDGTLDNNFGAEGKVTTDFGADYDNGYSVAMQPDGRIIVAGTTYIGEDSHFALVRYNADGTLDNSFGAAGKVIADFGTPNDRGESVAMQPDGKIVVAGSASNSTNDGRVFAVARYISGLNIGIVELSLDNTAPLIYPNPIVNHATLEYTLSAVETLSIHLLDMQGRTVQTFIEGKHQAAGAHQQAIELSEDLPAGSYLIVLSSPKGRLTVQMVK
ncbi:MAG: T9SS type A sorting domain-containing protein [Flavobacteriales bacterium]|nr:T9SS type A sorting domain-containing protein [Flavobacteriales bacterium]